jgi:hypothetical protein
MTYKCSALNNTGRQCRNIAKYQTYYQGDDEIISKKEPGWVRVYFCEKHIEDFKKKQKNTKRI